MRAAAPELGELHKMQFLWEKNCQSYGTLAAGADYILWPDSGGALIAVVTGRKSSDGRDGGLSRQASRVVL
jgi:hypothetical protein